MPSPNPATRQGFRVLDLRDSVGSAIVLADNEPHRATYRAFITGFAPAATPTDIVTITGSATKTIRVRQIILSGTATAASNVLAFLVRRSTADTGGTPTTITPVSSDLTDDAVTAVLRSYGANPSLGTTIGTIDGGRLNLAPAANGSIDRLMFQYGWQNDKTIILSGAADTLAINFAGAAWPSGGVLDIGIVWSEE